MARALYYYLAIYSFHILYISIKFYNYLLSSD